MLVNKVTFVCFRGGAKAPLDPPLMYNRLRILRKTEYVPNRTCCYAAMICTILQHVLNSHKVEKHW